jgi:cell division protein FtsQ
MPQDGRWKPGAGGDSAGVKLDDGLSPEPEFEDFAGDAEEQQFLRAPKRVAVRKSAIPKKTANRIRLGSLCVAALIVVLGVGLSIQRYGATSWRFRIESSDNIEIAGIKNVSRAQVMDVMGGDIGRNIFFVPLDQRRQQLEEINWVESATVMRLLPDRIRISVKERTPIAFARVGARVQLIDAGGVLMELPRTKANYSFPVITGFQEAEPLSTRAARMRIFAAVMKDLDSGGANYSRDISEIELSDPDDVRITVDDSAGAVVVHLGTGNYLERYRIFIAHVNEWREQFKRLDSVDLRYDGQIVVNPDSRAAQTIQSSQF